jgi:hypothetical protein
MTIVYSTMPLLGACKFFDHSSVAILDVGKSAMIGCFEEHVIDVEVMREVEGKEVGAAFVALGRAMGSKNWLEFISVLYL